MALSGFGKFVFLSSDDGFFPQVMEQQEVPKTSPLHLLFLAKFYPEVCIT